MGSPLKVEISSQLIPPSKLLKILLSGPPLSILYPFLFICHDEAYKILELLGSITSDQIDDGNYKGKTVIDIVTDLKPEKDGYFVIGKSIVKVESGTPTLISGPLAID